MPKYLGEHVSAACAPNGDGQCDGYDYDSPVPGEQCECVCHDNNDLPGTVAAVKIWHDRYYAADGKEPQAADEEVSDIVFKALNALSAEDSRRRPANQEHEHFEVTGSPDWDGYATYSIPVTMAGQEVTINITHTKHL